MVKYATEEERKAARRETYKRWYQNHKEKKSEYYKQWQQEHKEKRAEYQKQYRKEHNEEKTEYNKQYRQTPFGRASNLLGKYRKADKEMGRGECTLTAQWIIENIFTQKCAHCEKTGWNKLGCNRLDNALPHTPENVEPCCGECNVKFSGGRPKKTPVI